VIAISCIGLISYTAYVVRKALKDIAIRRIIGASFGDIYGMYQGMFGLLLGIGLAAVVPVSWYFLDRWLEQFAYHVVLRPLDYGIAVVGMVVIVGLVVGYYVWRSVRISPAKIIREQ
jgi:ABC-type antimicrobial peptide transport system permease subunit